MILRGGRNAMKSREVYPCEIMQVLHRTGPLARTALPTGFLSHLFIKAGSWSARPKFSC